MSQADRITGSIDARFHTVSHYNSPADVLDDKALSAAEKRAILSSWASDMYAVDSQPSLREIPGIARPMLLADIMAARRQLDEDFLPGQTPFAAARGNGARPRIMVSAKSRWDSEASVRRYRRLLETQLTDHERRFVERRLGEELAALGQNRDGGMQRRT